MIFSNFFLKLAQTYQKHEINIYFSFCQLHFPVWILYLLQKLSPFLAKERIFNWDHEPISCSSCLELRSWMQTFRNQVGSSKEIVAQFENFLKQFLKVIMFSKEAHVSLWGPWNLSYLDIFWNYILSCKTANYKQATFVPKMNYEHSHYRFQQW